MEITTEKYPSYTTVTPKGDIDANSSIPLDQKVGDLVEGGESNIHISCKEVPYISSAGLGVFISKLDEIQAKSGDLVLSGMRENVKEAVNLLGLDQMVTIFDSEVDVEKYFNQE
ncbi:MAG: STAS domain-containing protein [Bacteroidota bacterium]